MLYVLIAPLDLVGGNYALHAGAALQTILVFPGFNVAVMACPAIVRHGS